ncbi:hypothetical protein IEQ34_021172 [Dendrobium chrysotoxum]|uniref:Uncharacterized protein n=1 Tax=Dendrobium chrysotoxum TaxID=161865 RepID=A0AAV7FL63_DENCH|nr:hypothetical protein IEQ34_021172 [Dendrobium chrysotoxum]
MFELGFDEVLLKFLKYRKASLNSLQQLDEFYVKNEVGYEIGESEYMNDYRRLRIELLQDAKEAEEACSVKLCAERWNFINSRSVDSIENMLDDL